MADVFTPKKRSQIMSRVKSRGNLATEVRLAAIFRKYGLRGWRRNNALFGRPDFVFKTARLAVFVDGCFWHGCPTHGGIPSTNRSFWKRKLERNRQRDELVTQTLRELGWRVIRIWQHDLKRAAVTARQIGRILGQKGKFDAAQRPYSTRDR